MQKSVFLSLCILYFVQGIPYGVQKALPLYLHDAYQYKLDFATKTSLLMIPWIILKPLVGINVTSGKSGYASICWGMGLSAVLNTLLSILVSTDVNMHSIALFYFGIGIVFSVNLASVCIDVGTDQLAIMSANSKSDLKSLGLSNSVQVIGYKIGVMFAGVTLSIFTLSGALFFQSIIYVVSFCCIILLYPKYRFTYARAITYKPTIKWCNMDIRTLLFRIQTQFKMILTSGSYPLLLYLLLYKLGEVGAVTIYPLLLNKKDVSRQEIYWATSLILDPLSLAGSFIGGVLCQVPKITTPLTTLPKVLSAVGLARIIPIVMQFYILSSYSISTLWIVPASFLVFFGGITSTLTFTLMMSASCAMPEYCRTFHHTLLCSVEVFGKLIFSSYVGSLYEIFGMTTVYIIFSISVILSSFVSYFCCATVMEGSQMHAL